MEPVENPTAASPHGRPDRRPAVSRRRRSARRWAAAMLAGLVVLGAAGCTEDDSAEPDEEVEAVIGDAATEEADDATTSAPPDTDAPDTSAPEDTAPPEPAGAPDPEAAASGLYAAWKAGDRAAAANVAEAAAVEGIFGAAPGDYSLYNRCNTGEFGQSTCLYRGDPGTIQFSMRERDGAWVVTTAIFSGP